MCTQFQKISKLIFDKISNYCKNLGKVCRVVALLDAILGLLILIIFLIRRLRSTSATSEYTETTVNDIIILGLHACEIASAIVLYEGVRREIVCMIKLWFCYCIARFVALSLTVYPNLVSYSRAKVPLFVYGFEAAFTIFHISQCIFLLVLRHQSKSSPDGNSSCNIPANSSIENTGESVVVQQNQQSDIEMENRV